jgi:non-ribosomal peptide synthetase component F
LARVRETTLGAYAHQDLPFEKLVEELRPERDLSRTPLFQLKLVMQNAPLPAIELPGLRLFSEEVSGGTAKFDLTLFVEETPDGLSCTWQYNSDLFILRTIERLAATFAQLLEQIVRAPDARLGELIDALNESEKKKLAAANFERFKAVKAKAVSQLS